MNREPNVSKLDGLSPQGAPMTHSLLINNYRFGEKTISDNKKSTSYALIVYLILMTCFYWTGDIDYNKVKISWIWISGVLGFIISIFSVLACISFFTNAKEMNSISSEGRALENKFDLPLFQHFFSYNAKVWNFKSFSKLLIPVFLINLTSFAIWIIIALSISNWIGLCLTIMVFIALFVSVIWYQKWCAAHLQG